MKRLVMYKWGGLSDDLLCNELAELGYDIVLYEKKCQHYTRDLFFAQGLIEVIHENDAQAVVSNDYFPIISMVCKTLDIHYYSWVYDSPHYTLYAKTVGYKCNHIGCFDRMLVERLENEGIGTVKHLPLGCNWKDWEAVLSSPEKKSGYESDISFVGSLYVDKYNYYDTIKDLHIKQRADDTIEKQCFDYKRDHIQSFFDDRQEDINDLKEKVYGILAEEKLLPGDDYMEDIEYIFNSSYLEKKVTIEERKRLLTSIAEEYEDFDIYTDSDLSDIPILRLHSRGYVDYYREMPLVFGRSRINLNITLRSIKTGIPLRALDIMGCGGFLLSNYQEELDEYFKDGKEIVMFFSREDCMEKINYYLGHEDERKKIAASGHEAVMKRLNYKNQLKKLLTEI